MARGGGAVVPPHEVPRLTIVLRHLTDAGGEALRDLDPDRAFLARRAALAERGQSAAATSPSSSPAWPHGTSSGTHPQGGRGPSSASPLALELLGPDWRRRAPRQAREDYERFLIAVSALLGGGPLPAEAVSEAAEAAWRLLERRLPGAALPAAGRLSPGPGHPPGAARAAVAAVRDALFDGAELGTGLDEAVVPEVARRCAALRQWRDEIGAGSKAAAAAAAAGAAGTGTAAAAAAAGAAAAARAAAATAAAAPSEYGARLSIRPPWRARDAAAEDDGGWWWRPGADAAHDAAAAAAAFAAAAAQPAAAASRLLAQALGGLAAADAAAAAAPITSPQCPSAAAAAAAAGDHDVDINSDDERRGRGRGGAGLLWLERWARGVTGAEQAGDLALAVCTALAGSAGAAGDEDALAAQLLDLLGDSAFERVAEVMERRRELSAALERAAKKVKAERAAAAQFEDDEAGAAAAAMPSYGTAVSIQSESQRQMAKYERKAARRKGGGAGGGNQGGGGQGGGGGGASAAAAEAAAWLQGVGFEALADTERPRRDSEWFAFNSLMGDGAGQQRSALPLGSTRKWVFPFVVFFFPYGRSARRVLSRRSFVFRFRFRFRCRCRFRFRRRCLSHTHIQGPRPIPYPKNAHAHAHTQTRAHNHPNPPPPPPKKTGPSRATRRSACPRPKRSRRRRPASSWRWPLCPLGRASPSKGSRRSTACSRASSPRRSGPTRTCWCARRRGRARPTSP